MSRRKCRIVLTALFLMSSRNAYAYSSYACLKDLMPLSDRAALQAKREGVEAPFLVNGKFIVFPEISSSKVTGFFFYGPQHAAYFDAVERKGRTEPLADLAFKSEEGIYDLVAQPEGLETVTIQFLPGFRLQPTGKSGPAVLGASVLPVVGAFVSRPDLGKTTYVDPVSVNEIEVKRWMSERWTGRRPASPEEISVNRTILRLKQSRSKDPSELAEPLKRELGLRKAWIRGHNLDEKAFKQLAATLDGSCKE